MSTPSTSSHASAAELRRSAQDHLWLHFTQMGDFRERPLPVIVSGEGCHLTDVDGRRYLDGLAGLFAVQIGYSHGEEIGEAAAAQMRELPFYTNWNYAHPRSIELAEEVASLAPDGFERVFFTSGGAESVESA
jgi:adenosylmethionine-8-amino-7-oxononanoate aminotransferase